MGRDRRHRQEDPRRRPHPHGHSHRDPVSVDASDRGPVITISDFANKKLLNFRVGPTESNGGKPPSNYGCGPGGADADCANFEFGGELPLPGNPFFVGTTNVN